MVWSHVHPSMDSITKPTYPRSLLALSDLGLHGLSLSSAFCPDRWAPAGEAPAEFGSPLSFCFRIGPALALPSFLLTVPSHKLCSLSWLSPAVPLSVSVSWSQWAMDIISLPKAGLSGTCSAARNSFLVLLVPAPTLRFDLPLTFLFRSICSSQLPIIA